MSEVYGPDARYRAESLDCVKGETLGSAQAAQDDEHARQAAVPVVQLRHMWKSLKGDAYHGLPHPRSDVHISCHTSGDLCA